MIIQNNMNPYLKKYNPGGKTENSSYDPTTSYVKPKKVTIDGKEMSTYSNEYRDLYNTGNIMPVDYEGLPNVYGPEVTVTAEAPDWLKEKRRLEAQGPIADAVRKGRNNFATGLAQGVGAFVLGAGEIMNTPLAAIGEVVSGRNDFKAILPNMERALSNVGVGEYKGNQQMTPGSALFPNNPIAAMVLDIPADILLTRGANTLFKQGLKQAPKMFGKMIDVNPNMGFKFADETIDAQKALREAEELALKQKQPVSYNKPELNKKYFQEYDYGVSQSEDVLRPVQKDIEELKNTYRTEFEKQWGKEYNEKDLLSYAKIREGIDPSGTTKFANQEFSDINNQFVTDFDVKNIDDIGQANALSDYTSGRYYGFNQNPTRGGHNLPFYREFMNPFLDDALNQNILTKDIELHRGFGTDVFTVVRDGRVIENVPKSKILPGDIIDTGNRYQSTSLIKNPHFDYQEKLIVPKGTSFGYANKQGLSYVPAELELTLPRNTLYKALDDGSFKVIKDQGQGILPESSMSTIAKASDDVVEQMPNTKEIEQITTYKNDLLNRLKTTEEGKRRLANLGLTPEDLNDIDLYFNAGGSRAMAGRIDYNGNPYVNINFKEIAGGTGLTPMNTASHEIGHALQYLAAKKRFEKLGIPLDDRVYSGVNIRTQADDEMIDWLKSVNQSEIDFKKSMGTYDQLPGINQNLTNENIPEGINKTYITERAEPYAHLREFRTNMMDEGILKNEWDNVTEDMVDKFMKTSSGDRMKASLQNTLDFRKRMSMLLNKYPAVVPGILGTGVATYGVNKMMQQTPQNRYGGQNPYMPTKYKYGGPVDPVDPEDKDAAMRGMMKARMAIDSTLGRNPAAMRMTSVSPKEYIFTGDEMFYDEKQNIPAGATGTHYTTGEGNVMFPIIQEGQDGNLFFNRYASPTDKEAMRFETPEEASYFGENYKSVAPMMYNERPMQEDRKKLYQDINNIMSGKKENTGITMTKLNPDEEFTYQQWIKGLTPNLKGSAEDKNYDMRGAWKAGLEPELFYNDEQGNFQTAHPIDINQQGNIYEPHLGSRNPYTGKMLKGPNHPTYMHAIEGDMKAGYYPFMDFKTGDIYTKKHAQGGDTGHSTVEIERSERVYTPDGKLIMETPADAPTHEEGGVKVTLPAGSLVFPKKYYKALDAASGLPAFKKIADTMLNNAEKAYLRGEAYSSGGKRQ